MFSFTSDPFRLYCSNGVLQICSAFTNSAVFRLKKTWEKLSKTVELHMSQKYTCYSFAFDDFRRSKQLTSSKALCLPTGDSVTYETLSIDAIRHLFLT